MISDIALSRTGGPVLLRVASDRFPQSIAGVVWRYGADKSKEGKAGIFTTDAPSFSLGVPTTVLDKYFLIEGAVLHQNDDPPTPYLVSVSLTQGEQVLFQGPPPDGGSGTIGSADMPFHLAFRLIADGGQG